MTDLTNPWEQIGRRVAGEAAAAAALSFAHGQRCLTVVHGDPESAEDEAALHRLHDGMFNLAVRAGGTHQQLVRTHGTNDTTTWWWTSSEQLNADQIVQQATRVAHSCARPWWRISDNPA